jgi:hypothetical protein
MLLILRCGPNLEVVLEWALPGVQLPLCALKRLGSIRVSVLIPVAVLGARRVRPRGETKFVVIDLQLEPIRTSEPSAIGSTTATAASSVLVRIDVPVEGVEVHPFDLEFLEAANLCAVGTCG